MKKIIVIGCPGSGKTTFSVRLGRALGLPLFHLDAIWHKPDRTHISREEFDARLGDLLRQDSWIIDGNYSRTAERRIAACDTVILFDLPTEVCLAGAVARLGEKRADMPWVDTTLDPALQREIEQFREGTLPMLYRLIAQYGADKTVAVFKSRGEADAFLRQVAQES